MYCLAYGYFTIKIDSKNSRKEASNCTKNCLNFSFCKFNTKINDIQIFYTIK